jgi:surface antigen
MERIMSPKYLIAATLAALVLGACESNPSKEDVGMVSGAVLGGVLGHQIGGGSGNAIATIGGAALGGFVGSRIGRSMDREDQRKTAQALEASPDQRASSWRNPNTGQSYSVTPKRTYEGADGPCRDFETTTEIDGRKETVHGTACRQADGNWKTG